MGHFGDVLLSQSRLSQIWNRPSSVSRPEVVRGDQIWLRQEIGWEERLRNDLFCVRCDVKP